MKPAASNLSLLVDLTKREFKVRYLGSVLGTYWNVIHPCVMIGVYTLVFSQVMRARLGGIEDKFAYSIYLCSGLLAWNLLLEIMNRSVTTLLDNSSFLKKLSFPPIILFGATVLSSYINFFIAFGIFLVFLIFVKPMPLALFAVFIPVVLLMSMFSAGFGVALGCLNVFSRDFQQLTNVVFQLWFWFTPIVYATSALPPEAIFLLNFNPAYAFIEPLHQLMFFHQLPAPKFWLLMTSWVAIAGLLAAFVYRRTIARVRDHL